MRLVDVDDVHGVRAAVTTFASDTSSLRFVLVPLAKLAEPAHYEAVRDLQRSCDLVLIASGPIKRGGQAAEQASMFERIGRGPHIQLSTPPRRWEDVDRPFIKAPAADADATPARGPQRSGPLLVAAVSRIGRLATSSMARHLTRVDVARVLAANAGLALGPGPRGRGPLQHVERYGTSMRQPWREGLAESVRRVHRERQGEGLRIAVVHWVDALPTVARSLGALGYAPTEVDWILVFRWLPGEAPTGDRPGWFGQRLIDQAGGA
jgi:hypothetical protein